MSHSLTNSLDKLPASPHSAASRYHSSTDLAGKSGTEPPPGVFTCYSQPASPSKSRTGFAGAGGMHKTQSLNDNLHRSVDAYVHSV